MTMNMKKNGTDDVWDTKQAQKTFQVALEGLRPPRPDAVPEEMWKLMEDCWDQEPAIRPVFTEVRQRLASIL